MAKATIFIVFLTILTQLRGQGDWSRYRVPTRVMSRVGSLHRPLLSAPSKVISTGGESQQGDQNGPIVVPYSSSSGQPGFSSNAADILSRVNAEMDAKLKELRSKTSSAFDDLPISRSSSYLDRKPSFSRTEDPPSQSPSARTNSPVINVQSAPTYGSPEPTTSPISPATGVQRTWSRQPSPAPEPSPGTSPPASSTQNRFPLGIGVPRTSSSVGGGDSSPPSSCSASGANARLSVDQYRRPPGLTRSNALKNNSEVEPNKMDFSSPQPNSGNLGNQQSTTPGRVGNQPKPNGSSDTQRFRGSAVVTENLPNDGGKIVIKISGAQIDDDRMSQMIKEAKNAITAVFYAPLYKAKMVGTISFERTPSYVEL